MAALVTVDQNVRRKQKGSRLEIRELCELKFLYAGISSPVPSQEGQGLDSSPALLTLKLDVYPFGRAYGML